MFTKAMFYGFFGVAAFLPLAGVAKAQVPAVTGAAPMLLRPAPVVVLRAAPLAGARLAVGAGGAAAAARGATVARGAVARGGAAAGGLGRLFWPAVLGCAFLTDDFCGANPPVVRQLAKHLGVDEAVATQVMNYAGSKERVDAILAGTLHVWYQRPQVMNADNRFVVTITNNGQQEAASALRVVIENAETRRQELNYVSYGYRLEPGYSWDLSMSVQDDFATPGLKTVKIINQPKGITTSAYNVLVVPAVKQSSVRPG